MWGGFDDCGQCILYSTRPIGEEGAIANNVVCSFSLVLIEILTTFKRGVNRIDLCWKFVVEMMNSPKKEK